MTSPLYPLCMNSFICQIFVSLSPPQTHTYPAGANAEQLCAPAIETCKGNIS